MTARAWPDKFIAFTSNHIASWTKSATWRNFILQAFRRKAQADLWDIVEYFVDNDFNATSTILLLIVAVFTLARTKRNPATPSSRNSASKTHRGKSDSAGPLTKRG